MKAPTRDRYLLDLVLTDCDFITADVVPGFSDHFGTKVTIKFTMPQQEVVERFCFNYKKANWEALINDLHQVNWMMFLGGLDVDDAVTTFTRELLRLIKIHVPSRMVFFPECQRTLGSHYNALRQCRRKWKQSERPWLRPSAMLVQESFARNSSCTYKTRKVNLSRWSRPQSAGGQFLSLFSEKLNLFARYHL